MAIDFLDIVMEAKGKKSVKITPDQSDGQTDYTEDIDEEVSDDEQEEEPDNQEATSEDDNLESEEFSEDEDDPTDYTETEEEIGDDEPGDDFETGDGEDEVTDYTSDDEGDGGDEYQDSDDPEQSDDYTDDSMGDGSDENLDGEPQETEEEGPTDDEKKNKALLEDLIRLKEIVVNFIDKTSSIKGNSIDNVTITNQIANNVSQLSKQIHNYIVYRFSNETYVRNLYFYNYSVEALNISINMLKKINSFKHNK